MRREIKGKAKAAVKRNYIPCVCSALIAIVFTVLLTYFGNVGDQTQKQSVTLLMYYVVQFCLLSPLLVGIHKFFLQNAKEKGVYKDMLFSFRMENYGKVFITMFFKDLYCCLWMLLFIIPGIVKMYEYRMIPFILSEHPELSRKEVFRMSKEMMKGKKWDAFVLDLSFVGWMILGICTLGILNVFWVNPYIYATNAEFYVFLKKEQGCSKHE